MPDTTPSIAVDDDRAQHRLVVRRDGATAFLDYRLEPGRLILVHTEVPEQFEGQGVGSALVRHAVDRARAEGLTVAPWCPFARGWLRRHPEVAETVAIDWKSTPESG
jgi:predicted GNAT family acetyltransferase